MAEKESILKFSVLQFGVQRRLQNLYPVDQLIMLQKQSEEINSAACRKDKQWYISHFVLTDILVKILHKIFQVATSWYQ